MSSSEATGKSSGLGEGHLPHQLHQFLDFVLPRQRRYLGAILLLSLLGHLFCFAVFQIQVTPSMRPPRPPQQVTLASMPALQSEIHEATVSFLDIRDPSVFAVPPILPGEERKMMGQPEVYAPPLDLLFGNKMTLGVGLAAGLDAVEVRAIRAMESAKAGPMPITIETPPPLSGSSFLFSGPVAKRTCIRKPDLPKPEVKNILGCTTIQILVNERGLVEFAHVEESCGDPSIDQLGLNASRSLIFAPSTRSESSLEQGKVMIYWDFVEKSVPLDVRPSVPAQAADAAGANS